MSDSLQTSQTGRLLEITLNRPGKRNALNLELCRELVTALDQAASDPAVGAVLLSGNGPVFCAGMDLSEVLSASGRLNDIHQQLFSIGAHMTKPIVAAVHGAALAGGTGLVANAHIVIASEDATFGLTEIRIGLWPFLIFWAVSAALGERRAIELSLSGRIFSAEEAYQWGLVHHLVSARELRDRARLIAGSLAISSPGALRTGLMFVQKIRNRTATEASEIGCRMRDEIFQSPDLREGISAFHEKRSPDWPSLKS